MLGSHRFKPLSLDLRDFDREICSFSILLTCQLRRKFYITGPPAPAPLQTELSRFCEMIYLLELETHIKNEENTLKELNEIFLMVYGVPK